MTPSSSSTSGNDAHYAPEKGWIGHSSTNKGFFRSDLQNNPWLQLHIKPTFVSGITITNRKDGAGDLRDLKVRAGRSSSPLSNEVVGEYKGPGAKGGSYEIKFTRNVRTEYITIQRHGKGVLEINGIDVHQSGKFDFYQISMIQ